MAGRGLQHIPLRIPKEWDAAWYAQHIREVLALADTRNAVEGSGITITGQSGELATISASEDLQNLLLQSFVLAQPSGFLGFERTLAGETGVIQIIDGGPDANITVEIIDGGINLGKLVELSSMGVLGNPVDGVGEVQNVQAEVDKAVLHRSGTDMLFEPIDHTYVSDFDEAAQDAVGGIVANTSSILLAYNDATPSISATIVDEYVQDLIAAVLTDSTSVDFVYDDLTGTILANLNYANPSGLIGMSSVNGSAGTPLRSDARHAIDPAIAPTWTGNHTFTPASGNTIFHAGNVRLDLDNQEIQIGAGQDFRIYHDGSNSILRTDTGEIQALIGSGIAATFANGSSTVRTVTARPSTCLLSMLDPSGSKGYFGYDGSNNFDVWNFLNGSLTFGSNNQTRMQFPAAGGLTIAQQTVAAGATAGAGALPATPQEFLTVTVNGNVRKIPLYLN